MRVYLLLALAGVLAACSSQPQRSTASEQARAASEAVVPEPVAAKSAGSAEAAKPAGKIPSGYRRETRNGKELFCRNETISGSRFPTEKTCFTREQLERTVPQNESTMDGVGEEAEPCRGGTACDDGT